jgi:hypothetical protein
MGKSGFAVELPKSQKHEYPVLLLTTILCGFICPLLNYMLTSLGAFTRTNAPIPIGVFYILDVFPACWAGTAVFASLRFSVSRCVPLLLMPSLSVVVGSIELGVDTGWMIIRGALIFTALSEPVIFCCWLLVTVAAKPVGRYLKHELIYAATLILFGYALVIVARLGTQAFYWKVFSSWWGTVTSPSDWVSKLGKNVLGELCSFIVAFLTYTLLWGIFERGLISRIGRLLRRIWDATAA